MSQKSWAESEVELAKSKSDEYGGMCYDAALDVYNYFMNQDHSGASHDITTNILNRLLHYKPLTPIEDTPDSWSFEFTSSIDGEVYDCFFCKRMSSLCKRVYSDRTEYSDHDSVMCVDATTKLQYYSGFVTRLVYDMMPITFPYYPNVKPILVYCEDFQYDDNPHSDFDTLGVYHLDTPDGRHIRLDKFYKWDYTEDSWISISKDEYLVRKGGAVSDD